MGRDGATTYEARSDLIEEVVLEAVVGNLRPDEQLLESRAREPRGDVFQKGEQFDSEMSGGRLADSLYGCRSNVQSRIALVLDMCAVNNL